MAKRSKVPKYSHHKPTGQARVQIDGKSVYLGVFDSPESKVRYQQLLLKLQRDSERKPEDASLTVGALVVMYIGHCREFYRKNGKETSEVGCVQQAMKPVVKLYRDTLAAEFSPSCLRRVRDEMIRLKWVRTSINRHIFRIRKMFRWALSVEALKSPDVLELLRAVDGLQKNRSPAKESKPVRAVDMASVSAVEPHIRPTVWAMIRLQLLTGMRPGEVRLMKLEDIDRTGELWVYRPSEHKLEHREIDRPINIGFEGQKILLPYLKADTAQYLFETRGGKHYTKDAYCREISRACERAKIDSWSPNQLRHRFATNISKRYGLEASRVILGHSSAETTLIYAERDQEAAKAVIRQIG